MVKLTSNIRTDLQISILRKLKHATYQDFEKLGNEKVFTAMGDINMLTNLPEVFMNVINAIIIVVCCFVYLFIMSPIGGLFILAFMFALLVFYLVRNKGVEKRLNEIRNLQNHFWRYLNDLLLGFRETKMSMKRNENIHTKFLEKNLKESKDMSIQASIKYLDNELTGSYSWFLTLGVIMFLLPRLFNMNHLDVTAFLITILYLIGPVAVLIALVPTYTNVKIALERLDIFNKKLNTDFVSEETLQKSDAFGEFRSIRFENVKYEYFDEKEQKNFVLGPINVEISGGEMLFVVGGNGSGKTTFAYLLTGLYRPCEGNIYINDVLVTDENTPLFRSRFSAIYTNSYLFAENYDDFELSEGNRTLANYIELMKLSGIIKFNNEKNTLDRNLSRGQQKRLAMIYALLENNDIVVLDEWAAEQDPSFRNYFYKVLLPELKEKGKTIIAITHDDDFYSHCDRIVKFNYGKIVMDQKEENSIEQVVENLN